HPALPPLPTHALPISSVEGESLSTLAPERLSNNQLRIVDANLRDPRHRTLGKVRLYVKRSLVLLGQTQRRHPLSLKYPVQMGWRDRKSTRLNSSHVEI